jgi:hypothetical protein
MLVLEGSDLYEKGKKVEQLHLEEGQAYGPCIIMERSAGPLRESSLTEAEEKTLTESAGGKKVLLTLEGVFQRGDTKNANNRIYPDSIWKKVLEKDGKWLKAIGEGDMLGEADHPKDGDTLLSRVACVVTDLRRDENDNKAILGRISVFDTAAGRNLKAIHEGGGRLGVSSRGQGSVVRMDGSDVVQEDFDLQTWDIVYNPSTPGAYPNEVVEQLQTARRAMGEKPGLTEQVTKVSKNRPNSWTSILEALTVHKVDTSKPLHEAMADVRTAYRENAVTEGPLTDVEREALSFYVNASFQGSASTGAGNHVARITIGENVTTIRARSPEELKARIAEHLPETPVAVEIDRSEAIYEECAARFGPLLDAQLEKAAAALEEARQAKAGTTEISARLAAAKSLIEQFANRTRSAEGDISEVKSEVSAAEQLIEAMAEEFLAEGLTSAVAAIAATHPDLEDLPVALSRTSSLREAVEVTKKMKDNRSSLLEREPLGIRDLRINEALKASRDREAQTLEEQHSPVEKRETPALSTTKSVVETIQERGLGK